MNPVIVIGAGGHAQVLIDALLLCNADIMGATDPMKQGELAPGIPVLGDDEVVLQHPPSSVLLVNGLGSVGSTRRRREVFERFKALGYSFGSVIHPSAVVAKTALLGEGAQIMAGAVVQPGCAIGPNSLINTRASVDHGCRIGAHTHVAPGATLSGDVTLGEGVHVGSGATIIQGVGVGDDSIIGAGSLVLRDVPRRITVAGSPARRIDEAVD